MMGLLSLGLGNAGHVVFGLDLGASDMGRTPVVPLVRPTEPESAKMLIDKPFLWPDRQSAQRALVAILLQECEALAGRERLPWRCADGLYHDARLSV